MAPSPQPVADETERVRAWLLGMTKQGEDRIWRGAETALALFDRLVAERAAYREQAVNRGWNWNLCNAYGRDEYQRYLENEVDRTLEVMLGRKSLAQAFNDSPPTLPQAPLPQEPLS